MRKNVKQSYKNFGACYCFMPHQKLDGKLNVNKSKKHIFSAVVQPLTVNKNTY